MAGGEILAIGALAGVVIFGFAYMKGHSNGVASEVKKQVKAEKRLDGQSDTVAIDTDEIARKLSSKINTRMTGQSKANLKAITDAALIQGRLEGRADGYRKGFKDAVKTPNTCYGDPAFLPDSLRLGASSRYEAVFGSPKLAGQNARSGEMHDNLSDNVPDD